MASADTREMRFSAPAQSTASGAGWGMVAVLGALAVVWVGLVSQHWVRGRWAMTATAILLTIAVCSFWRLHLLQSLSPGWSTLLTSLVACQLCLLLARRPGGFLMGWLGASGCAIFVYAMLWTFSQREQEPGLQPMATAALVLSIGVIAKPAVVLCCILLSLLVFLDERNRVGNAWHGALLLLTPVVLCLLSALGLSYIARHAGVELFWNPMADGADTVPEIGPRSLHFLSAQKPALWFCLGSLMGRAVEGRVKSLDAATLFLLFFLPVIGGTHRIPHPMTTLDFSLVVYSGAGALLALDPPQTALGKIVVVAGTALGAAAWFM